MKQRRNHIPDPRKDTGDAVEHISLRVVALIHLCSGALILFLDFTGAQNDLHGARRRVLLRCQGYRLCVHIDIQNGGSAQTLWMQAILDGTRDDKEKILDDLIKYCGLDTLAMVEIYEALKKVTTNA